MKIFLIGRHCSGKGEVLNILDSMGIKVGREFSNLPQYEPNIYIDEKYERYSADDVEKIFEQNSYMYIGGFNEFGILDGYEYYRGLSYYTYDNSDVMSLTPEALVSINKKLVKDPVLFVWMDSSRDSRIRRYVDESRQYDFAVIENRESLYDRDFIKHLRNFKSEGMLYFNNEEPGRIAAIIASIIMHPDLAKIFIENFN